MDAYIKLAQEAVEEYVKKGERLTPPADLPKELLEKQGGVFVTIFKNDNLRGCIGTILPTKENLAEEIIHNAVAACSIDNRFKAIRKDELPYLNYEVSVLNYPEILTDLENHDPKHKGLIVKCQDDRSGLLLPDIKEVDTPEKQLAIACQKGGIDPGKDKIQCFCFSIEKHT